MPDPISLILSLTALIFSIWSFWKTREMTVNQVRSATYAGIMSRLFELNQLEIEKPHLFEQLYNEFNPQAVAKGGGGLAHYLFMLFNLYAEIYTQYEKYNLFDEEQMRVWARRIINDFKGRQFLRGYWRAELVNYPKEYTQSFKEFITRALEKAEREEQRQ